MPKRGGRSGKRDVQEEPYIFLVEKHATKKVSSCSNPPPPPPPLSSSLFLRSAPAPLSSPPPPPPSFPTSKPTLPPRKQVGSNLHFGHEKTRYVTNTDEKFLHPPMAHENYQADYKNAGMNLQQVHFKLGDDKPTYTVSGKMKDHTLAGHEPGKSGVSVSFLLPYLLLLPLSAFLSSLRSTPLVSVLSPLPSLSQPSRSRTRRSVCISRLGGTRSSTSRRQRGFTGGSLAILSRCGSTRTAWQRRTLFLAMVSERERERGRGTER